MTTAVLSSFPRQRGARRRGDDPHPQRTGDRQPPLKRHRARHARHLDARCSPSDCANLETPRRAARVRLRQDGARVPPHRRRSRNLEAVIMGDRRVGGAGRCSRTAPAAGRPITLTWWLHAASIRLSARPSVSLSSSDYHRCRRRAVARTRPRRAVGWRQGPVASRSISLSSQDPVLRMMRVSRGSDPGRGHRDRKDPALRPIEAHQGVRRLVPLEPDSPRHRTVVRATRHGSRRGAEGLSSAQSVLGKFRRSRAPTMSRDRDGVGHR